MEAGAMSWLLLTVMAVSAATAVAAAGSIPGCCSPDKWQGRQSVTYLAARQGFTYTAKLEIDVTYDAVKNRTVLAMNRTDDYGTDRYQFLYFYGTGKGYRHDISNASCEARNIGTVFPKRCIPVTAKVLNSNVPVQTDNGTVQASRVYYEKYPADSRRYGLLLARDTDCFPYAETVVQSSLDTFKVSRSIYMNLTEGIVSEDVFKLPAPCQQIASG